MTWHHWVTQAGKEQTLHVVDHTGAEVYSVTKPETEGFAGGARREIVYEAMANEALRAATGGDVAYAVDILTNYMTNDIQSEQPTG